MRSHVQLTHVLRDAAVSGLFADIVLCLLYCAVCFSMVLFMVLSKVSCGHPI